MFTVRLLNSASVGLTNNNNLNSTPKVKVHSDSRPGIPLFKAGLKKTGSSSLRFSANQHGDEFVKAHTENNNPSRQKETGFISWLFDDFNFNDYDLPTYYNYW